MEERTCPHLYAGFEQGPIRPPSEARSLLVRITRNCHWNRCTFCPVYKDTRFSVRPGEHVKQDLDAIAAHVESLSLLSSGPGILLEQDVREAAQRLPREQISCFRAALSWYLSGMESVFFQDADSLVLKPVKLLEIMNHLKMLFPQVKRITSYSRSDTIDRREVEELRALREAGLNRIHIGMESGSDAVLAMVGKGVTQEIQVRAGRKVRNAGIELSEYYMPGLGGCDLYRENALESADALNRINPDFIRLRTLAIPDRAPLADDVRSGRFKKCPDILAVKEILLFLENLEGVSSYVTSDHVLNLIPELEGRLPDERNRMMDLLHHFLSLDPEHRFLFQLGRRLGILTRFADLEDPGTRAEIRATAARLGVTRENLDEVTALITRRFI